MRGPLPASLSMEEGLALPGLGDSLQGTRRPELRVKVTVLLAGSAQHWLGDGRLQGERFIGSGMGWQGREVRSVP